MIDKPTIARIMDSTKIEEVVSRLSRSRSEASTMSDSVLSITIPILLSPCLQPEVSAIALLAARAEMPSTS